MNLSGALVENDGEHSPIRIAGNKNTIVSACIIQELEEAKRASENVGKVSALTLEAQGFVSVRHV